MHVTLLITCVVDLMAPEVGDATVRVLRAAGCTVTCNLDQTCCGQPAWNAGYTAEAAAVARPTLAALEAELDGGADAVVVPAGSCATMVRLFWPELFEIERDQAAAARARRVGERVRELSELLADLGTSGGGRPGDAETPGPGADDGRAMPPLALPRTMRVALHQSCHMLRELRIIDQPRALLDAVDGCDVVAWDEADRCCGFGGSFSVKLPEASVAMADDKLRSLRTLDANGPDVVVGCDSSCLLHLRTRAEATGWDLQVRHLAEVLAAALPPGDGEGSAP